MTKHNLEKGESSATKAPIVGVIIFGLFCLVFLALSVHHYVADLNEYKQLEASSTVAQATIVDRRAETNVDSDGCVSEHYSITYKFTDGTSWYTRTRSVSKSTYASLKGRDSVGIVYVPGNPKVSRLQSNFFLPLPAMPVFVLLFFAACACQLLCGSKGKAAAGQVFPIVLTLWQQICGSGGNSEPRSDKG